MSKPNTLISPSHMFSTRSLALGVVATVAATLLAVAPARAATEAYSNATPIAIPDVGDATPYPSQTQVQGEPRRIVEVTVALRQVSHANPEDVDVLLVSPGGKQAMVMSDACGDTALQNRTWAFGQSAPAAMTPPCADTLYRPTNVGAFTDPFNGAGTVFKYANFHRFIGGDPNGVWDLLVHDDTPNQKAGQIAAGWSLAIETAPADTVVPGAGDGTASPYPATREVSGLNGVIDDVDVTLAGVNHERPSDLDLLLVGPGGESVMLASDACFGPDPASRDRWSWDDEAPAPMPDQGSCGSGVFRPADHDPGDALPSPAPERPYGSALSAFDGTAPNGRWSLYAYDDATSDTGPASSAEGFFGQRFTLAITTRPRARVRAEPAALDLTEAETAELRLVRTGGGQGIGAGSVRVRSAPGTATQGADYEAIVTTVRFAPGQAEATVPVRTLPDADAEGPETFTVSLDSPSGDAAVADPSAATVTIRDPEPGSGEDPGPGADTTAPQTQIDSGPKRRVKRSKARLRFSATEPGARFECRLDRRAFKPCASPRTLKRLGAGRHRFAVRAVDGAGNVDPTPAKRRWKVVK